MPSSEPLTDTEELLAKLKAAARQAPVPEPDAPNSTTVLLSTCLNSPTAVEIHETLFAVSRLARKVDIARRVFTAYDEVWSSPRSSTQLQSDWWPILAAIFLRTAAASAGGLSPDAPGNSLVYINTCFNAIDLAPPNTPKDQMADVETIANSLLKRVLSR